jgi:hypothetical protein
MFPVIRRLAPWIAAIMILGMLASSFYFAFGLL